MLPTNLKLKLNILFESIFDALFALIVVAPLVVIFWSTTWKLYDLYILPSRPFLSGAVSWLFGFCAQMVLMFFQHSIEKNFHFENRKFVNSVILKAYALFLGHTFVSFWRGLWMVVDHTFTRDLGVVLLNLVHNIICLMTLRAFRNSLVPPFFVSIDRRDQYRMRTLLGKSHNRNFALFVDCLCSMFIEILVAFIWHDLWLIHDLYLFPDDLLYSAVLSLLIGYLSALTCFIMQSSTGILCERYDKQKLFIYEVFTLICCLSAINVWRGVWLLVTYYAGDSNKWNLILNTLAWILLMIVNCIFSLSAKDVLKDAEESGRYCTKFNTKFLSKNDKKSVEALTVYNTNNTNNRNS